MGSWRDQILKEFTPQVARLTLVADPDGMLLEEGVLEGIRERGFELIPFEDHVAFRYAYESKFRSCWNRGEKTDLVVVLRSPSSDLDALPYDLLEAGRKLSFSLSDLFPNLSYPVIAALDRSGLNALFDAQSKYAPGPLGENATKDFILRHVFEITPELIKEPKDMLLVLLRRHYRGRRLPAILDERLIQLLRQNVMFDDWPLETIVPDAQAFFAFLQERWPVFLDSLAKQDDRAIGEAAAEYSFELPGPALLPFDHHDVRIYIDNLFLEGFLQPVPHDQSPVLAKTWAAYGILVSPIENRSRRMEGLLDSIEKSLPTVDAYYEEWFRFAYKWAQLKVLSAEDWEFSENEAAFRKRIERITDQVDNIFLEWVVRHYVSLIHLPAISPVMLHHLPRFFAHSMLNTQRSKLAFLLVDGLALDQWIAMREVLFDMDSKLYVRENAVFAWIPTITTVSRQAAFAGKPPFYFPTSIHTVEKEPVLWRQFWVNQGLTKYEVAYAKGVSDGKSDELSELLSHPRLRVVGLVIDKVDRIMHGMELGAAGMHNQIRQWASQGFMRDLLNLLQTKGFQVYLASDHGNIEAKGVGRPAEGAVADLRCERVRVYNDSRLRAKIKEQFPSSMEWPPIGLPEDYLALIASNRAAFIQAGETIVGHGGISIEELIVPLVQIERRER